VATRRAPGRQRGRAAAIARWIRYRLIIPVFRSQHAAEYTARGVANGVFWGLTPTLGLQTTEILVTWFVARRLFRKDSSLVQALIWVWVNNPVTMVPMFYVFYVTGLLLSGDSSSPTGYATFVALWDSTAQSGWLGRVRTVATTIGWPMLLGSLPYAVLGSLVSYHWAVRVLRRRRARLRERAASQDV
jgi:uncharacterized protein